MPAPITSVTGVVASVNDGGFQLQDGLWLNYSKFDYAGPAKGQPAPQVGQRIDATVKSGKYLVTLNIDGFASVPQAPMQPATTTMVPPAQPVATPGLTLLQTSIVEKTIEVRIKLLGVVGMAQPTLFDFDTVDKLTDLVRALESFVMEDLIAANTPEDDDLDVTAEDVLDDAI